MAKPAQLLIIEPANELKFQGPFRTAVASYMRLTNPTDHDIYFKIKTTAPKKYCVRPNSGLLEPRESQEIAIVLQPFIFDSNEKNKHKFMVQSMVKPDDEEINLEDLWKKFPEKLMDSKLRCVFDCPLEPNQPAPNASVPINSASASNSKCFLSLVLQFIFLTSIYFSTTAVVERNETTGTFPSQMKLGNFCSQNEEELVDEDSSLLRAFKKLKEDERALRQENLQLKEQILQLRLQVDGRAKEPGLVAAARTAAVAPVHFQNTYSPPPLTDNQQQGEAMVLPCAILAVFMCIVGVLLGKVMYSEGNK
ncbi:vesicle-associated membrane protein-associated protein B-like isoform X1 [Anopheles cruzii]|uniref:vesicle-associated membrane protein-associated protein B-like isoform X1 n=1 Tax=Anopheles cruzii TaxID=68878 RepID=UPI0022EC538D|nr:vesicle-associated membrane protein-associated protein B-like isoform X1 [Anopheles cruzii]